MKRFGKVLLAVLCAVVLPALALESSLNIHGGKIIDVKRELKSVPHKDMDKLLAHGRLTPDPEGSGTVDEDIIDKAPALGSAFIIVTVQMSTTRISRFDYELKSGDKRYPCKAVSVAGRSFDPRQLAPVGANKAEVRLLFEVPDNLKSFELVSAYLNKDGKPELPLRPVPITVEE